MKTKRKHSVFSWLILILVLVIGFYVFTQSYKGEWTETDVLQDNLNDTVNTEIDGQSADENLLTQ